MPIHITKSYKYLKNIRYMYLYIMKENWKKIKSFSNYSCSNLGKIRNDTTKHISQLKPRKSGYIEINLINDLNKRINLRVHRIIAQTWLSNNENKLTVNHKNKIRNDNRVENLEWMTYREQAIHQHQYKCKIKRRINNNKGVWQCDIKTGKKIRYFRTIQEAALAVKGNSANISACALNKYGSSYGYKWKYDTKKMYSENKIIDEKWKLFETNGKHKYYISDYGRIRNNNYLLTPSEHASGYYHATIIKKTRFIHRIVAKYFAPNPQKKIMVNHKDGNKLNNNYKNLEWCTNKENIIHAINLGLFKKVKKVVHYDNDLNIIKIYNSTEQAAKELKICLTSVYKCCKEKIITCGKEKYRFKFLDNTDDLKNKRVTNVVISKFNKNAKKVIHYDDDLNIIKIYYSAGQAAQELNLDLSSICKCCRGKNKTCGNKKFKYLDDEDDLENKKVTGVTILKYRKNVKKVIQYDDELNIIKIYNLAKQAAKELNLNVSSIHQCCRGTNKTCGKEKYRFKFHDDTDDLENKKVTNVVISKFNKRAKKIIHYDDDLNIIKIYDSVSQASEKLGLSMSYVYRCCKKRQKTNGKKKFKYLNDNDDLENGKVILK